MNFDHQNLHRIKLAYASDLRRSTMIWSIRPSAKKLHEGALVASLDHGMWFYGDVYANQWYLHDTELEHSQDERVLTSSRFVVNIFTLSCLFFLESPCCHDTI